MKKSDFSIVVVNYNSYDFLRVLIESCNKFSYNNLEIIVIDNSLKWETLEYSNVSHFFQNQNIGHGSGINLGIQKATSDVVLVLDVDCHFLCKNFDLILLEEINNFDIIAVPGSIEKPIRAACILAKRDAVIDCDFRSTPNYQGCRKTPEGYDTAILAYYNMLKQNKKFNWFEIKRNRYNTLNGEEYCLNNQPIVYHHWHGSHLAERQVDFSYDLMEDKQKLFKTLLGD